MVPAAQSYNNSRLRMACQRQCSLWLTFSVLEAGAHVNQNRT
jgi:hypothetical protein